MNDTYGLTGSISSKSAALQLSLESKLIRLLPMAGWMMWPMIWKKKATPAQRQYCQLAVSMRRTKETGYGLWATPNTLDHLSQRSYVAMKRMATNGGRKNRTFPSNLREQVDPLMCQAYIDARTEANATPEMYPSMWPTPNASDNRDRGKWENPVVQRRVALGKQVNLSMIVQASSKSTALTENKGSLNPEFVCWLMGYSTEHLSCMRSAMQSFRKSHKNLSKHIKK